MGQINAFIEKVLQQDSNEPIKSDRVKTPDSLADYQPLLELQDKRQLVQVEVLNSSHTQSYQSMIVRLDFVRKLIFLDTLTPLNPFNPVIVGDTIAISHHDHGKILYLKGQLADIVTEDNEIFYVMTLPNEIDYKHRRFYQRLAVNDARTVKMRLWSPLRIPWYARVENISAGGARLLVGGNISDQLKKNTVLPNCDIELNSGQHICCKATVKGFRYQRRPYEHTEVSIEFSEMSYQQKNWLVQWVEFNNKRYPVGMAHC